MVSKISLRYLRSRSRNVTEEFCVVLINRLFNRIGLLGLG